MIERDTMHINQTHPIPAQISTYEFPFQNEIEYRSRVLLKNLSNEQIEEATIRINREIDNYFYDSKEEEISRLKSELEEGDERLIEFFEWDGGTQKNGRWDFKEEMLGELDIPTAENCRYINALKEITKYQNNYLPLPKDIPESECEEWPEGSQHQLFAVLAGWLLDEALRQMRIDSKNGCDFIIEAMEAVCYAEHLREAHLIRSYINRIGNEDLAKELKKLASEMNQQQQDKNKELRAEVTKKKHDRSIELNEIKHKKNHEAKDMAIKEWSKDPSKFPSATKAGIYYADWLLKKGIHYEPRTVTTWLREHVKKIGKRFR